MGSNRHKPVGEECDASHTNLRNESTTGKKCTPTTGQKIEECDVNIEPGSFNHASEHQDKSKSSCVEECVEDAH